MTIVGIDPGVNGAIARLDLDGNLLYVVPMPTMHIGGAKNKRVSVAQLRPLVRSEGIQRVRLENVWAFSKEEGATASFYFGAAVDAVRGAFEILHPVDLVLPKVWKAPWGIKGKLAGGDQQSLDAAKDLWPEHADKFKHKNRSGWSDACLIAEHYRMEVV